MVVKDTKIYKKMENKSWLSIEKILQNEKMPYYTYRKLFLFEKVLIFFFLGVS